VAAPSHEPDRTGTGRPPLRGLAAVVSQADIRRAINADELVLHYQPIVELASGRPRGVEALLRWAHPDGGLLPPDDFLPALAQAPVMPEVTSWVLRTACAAAARWPDWTMSVNVTARDVARAALVADVAEALSAAATAAERLVLELTETALVQDLPRAAGTLGRIRALGAGVALDDFGTGYSSMLYLRDLPVTEVKIDHAFMPRLETHADDRAIVTSLLTLARTVGLTAVAEGVESVGQADLLGSLGCPLAQGYLWSRPVPAEDLDGLYRDGISAPQSAGSRPGNPPDGRPGDRAHELLAQGASLHTIAAALNAAGYRTDRDTRWHPVSVAHLINDTARPAPSGDRRLRGSTAAHPPQWQESAHRRGPRATRKVDPLRELGFRPSR